MVNYGGRPARRNYLTPLEVKAKRKAWDEKYGQRNAIDVVLDAAKDELKNKSDKAHPGPRCGGAV